MRNPPENFSVPSSMQSAAAFAEASGSDAAWKALALRLAEEAQTCIDNAHWEVRFGSGDMLKTIKAIRLMKEVEAAEHLNADISDRAGKDGRA